MLTFPEQEKEQDMLILPEQLVSLLLLEFEMFEF